MSQQEIRIILPIAQKLVNHLPKEMDDQLKELIRIAKQGQDPIVVIEIMDLLSSHENVRRWTREQINLQSGQGETRFQYDPLAGNPSPVPASKKWICPKDDCAESLPIIQEDEDAPTCDVHKVAMVPAE